MRCLLKGGQVYQGGSFFSADVAVEKGRVADIASVITPCQGDRVFDLSHCFLVPGFLIDFQEIDNKNFSTETNIISGDKTEESKQTTEDDVV